jgi:hypothetical protein
MVKCVATRPSGAVPPGETAQRILCVRRGSNTSARENHPMNARLDLLAPAPGRASSSLQSSFVCCPRYVAGVDTPPDLVVGFVNIAERAGKLLRQALRAVVESSPPTRM